MSCNVLGHRHYWNWALPCVSPSFGNAYGLTLTHKKKVLTWYVFGEHSMVPPIITIVTRTITLSQNKREMHERKTMLNKYN
jgi:hypothetical protein